jgi:hypothetical protein
MERELNKLFSEHAIYTFMVIVGNMESRPFYVKRLLQNQVDIGKYLSNYIGKTNSDKLSSLLLIHIQLAKEAIENIESYKEIPMDKIKQNVNDIAQLLSNINPVAYPKDAIIAAFNQHNLFVVQIAMLQKGKKFQDIPSKFDEYYSHMLMISAIIISGILHPEYGAFYY